MIERILPQHVDNSFRGQLLAVWLFALVVLVKSAQSVAILFGGASVITGADGIPLDTYSPPAAQTVLCLWALLGLTRLAICLLCVLVLVRYRALIPFMLGLLLMYDVGRYLVLQFLPIVRVGTPPGPIVNSVLMALTIVGFALSLVPRRHPSARAA